MVGKGLSMVPPGSGARRGRGPAPPSNGSTWQRSHRRVMYFVGWRCSFVLDSDLQVQAQRDDLSRRKAADELDPRRWRFRHGTPERKASVVRSGGWVVLHHIGR